MTATSQSYGAVLGEALDARQAGRFAEAQAGFERAIDMDPRQAPAHFHLACLLHMTGRLDQAAISYRTAATLAPDVAMIHVNFGVCRQALGRLDEALDSLERAVALTPMSEDAHANLGLVLQSLGRLKEAEASMRRALALQPNAAMFHSNLGTLLRDQGRLDESIAAFERALAISPDSVPALVNLHLARFAKAEADAGALLSASARGRRPSTCTALLRRSSGVICGCVRRSEAKRLSKTTGRPQDALFRLRRSINTSTPVSPSRTKRTVAAGRGSKTLAMALP